MTQNLYLIHGDCEFKIYTQAKSLKHKAGSEGNQILEFIGSKDLTWQRLDEAINSDSLFSNQNFVVIDGLKDIRSFYPFVEDLVKFIDKAERLNNKLLIKNYGKIPKNTIIYKLINKKGQIIECNQPSTTEIISDIKKSLKISHEAAITLNNFTNGDLFAVSREIAKLRNYAAAKQINQIEAKDIYEICVDIHSPKELWLLSDLFASIVIAKDTAKRKQFNNLILDLLNQDINPMQIFYIFYNVILNGIKIKLLQQRGAGSGEIMKVNYFFARNFAEKLKQIPIEMLFKLNYKILRNEFLIKRGLISENTALIRVASGLTQLHSSSR